MVAIAIGVAIAAIFGGIDRDAAIRASVVTSVIVGFLVFVDHAVSSFAAYSDSVNGRPFATIGSKTPNYDGTFWESYLDTATHLVLPTLAIMLISFAGLQPVLPRVHARGSERRLRAYRAGEGAH